MITEEEIMNGQLKRINERLMQVHNISVEISNGNQYHIICDGVIAQCLSTAGEVLDYLEGFLKAVMILKDMEE